MLQLKNKQSPEGKFIFAVSEEDEEQGLIDKVKDIFTSSDKDELQTEQKLYMIGFNAGFSLSNTSQGIKAQITSGTISQNRTMIRLCILSLVFLVLVAVQ